MDDPQSPASSQQSAPNEENLENIASNQQDLQVFKTNYRNRPAAKEVSYYSTPSFNVLTESSTVDQNSTLQSFLQTNPQSNCSPELQTIRNGNYVYILLMKDREGRLLIKYYDYYFNPAKSVNQTKIKYNWFSPKKVTRKILYHELEADGVYDISSDRLESLAAATAQVFPKLLKTTWYSRGDKYVNASGAFHSFMEHHRMVGYFVEEIQVSESRKRGRDGNLKEPDKSEDFKKIQDHAPLINDEFKILWQKCGFIEKFDFFKKSSYAEIFAKLPSLTNPTGYSLIQLDYDNHFLKSSSSSQYLENLSKISFGIIAEANIKSKRNQPGLKEILNECTELNKAILEKQPVLPEAQNTLALLVLPYLFRKSHKQKGKDGTLWTPDKKEIQEGFIYYIKADNSFTSELEKLKTKVADRDKLYNLEPSPYIVITGPSLSNISSARIIINNVITYQVPTTSQALNVCLQMFKVFGKAFPKICNDVWYVVEYLVFEFKNESMKGGISTMIDKLNAICKVENV